MATDEIIFNPRYSLEDWASLAVITCLPIPCMGALLSGIPKHWSFLVSLILFPIVFILAWFRTYKRVRFGSSIIFEWFFLAPRIVEYAFIRDVSFGLLKTTQGMIAFPKCTNLEDFHAALEESRRFGRWRESQLEGELQRQQRETDKKILIFFLILISGGCLALLLKIWTF